jgi:hypothetical protein
MSTFTRLIWMFLAISCIGATHNRANAAPGDIFVEFLAVPESASSPGHAFVCFSLHLQQSIKEDCFGFYPKSLKDVFNGAGKVESELKRESASERFSKVTESFKTKIDAEKRSAAYTEIQKWSGSKYDLEVKNCGDMANAVASKLGLKPPPRDQFVRPVTFVKLLKNLNP